MFVPTWLIVMALAVFALSLMRSRHSGPEMAPSVDGLWAKADASKRKVLEYNHLIDDYLYDERQLVNAMELDSIRLRERFKHDPHRALQVATDWRDFADAVDVLTDERELLDVASGDNAFETFCDATKESSIAIEEIGQRVIGMLGDESCLKLAMAEIERERELDFADRMKLIEGRRRPRPSR